jgi:hypothetical protein
MTPAFALNIIPNALGDPHFTSGPCPNIVPPDGAACPNGAATCPAFYNPALLPAGYTSVSYCATVPAGLGFNAPGYTMMTMPLNAQEQQAFLAAAQKLASYVTDNVTVTVEAYKVAYLNSAGNNNLFFLGNEYWNPVCGADALLPPYSTQAPTIIQNPDGSFSYQNLPETYTEVLAALQTKNAANLTPLDLINYLPTQSQITVEWPAGPADFYAWQGSSNFSTDLVSNFLVGPASYYPVTPASQPFTLCAAPAAMKMLGFTPTFQVNGHTIDDINSPQNNMNVTLSGTDGALVIPDLTVIPPNTSPAPTWIYDPTDPAVVATQLPKAFFQNSLNLALPQGSCSDPTQCQFPNGANPGTDLVGVFNHELNHILGLMQSQYYKIGDEGTSLAYTYGTALFLLDLFDLDSDYVVPGYGHPGIQSNADFTAAPRNNDAREPNTIISASTAAGLTPWIQFGSHDHVMVYSLTGGPQYFPLMDATSQVYNPDGDIGFQEGFFGTQTTRQVVFLDPNLVNLSAMDTVHFNVQASGLSGTIDVDTIREYSELAAEGWNIDYTTLADAYDAPSPLAMWYQACFDASGVFTTSMNMNCKFSVTAQDLAALTQSGGGGGGGGGGGVLDLWTLVALTTTALSRARRRVAPLIAGATPATAHV